MMSLAQAPPMKVKDIQNPSPVHLTPKSPIKVHLRSVAHDSLSGAAQTMLQHTTPIVAVTPIKAVSELKTIV